MGIEMLASQERLSAKKAIRVSCVVITAILLSNNAYAIQNETGWPLNVNNWITSPTIVDLDSNISNGLEIIVGRSFLHAGPGSVLAYHYNNSSALSVSVASGESIETAPAIGDLLGDGNLALVIGTTNGRIFAWYSNGSGVLNSDGYFASTGGSISSSPAIADLDNNISNGLEIVVGSGDDKVYAWYSNGTLLWSRSTGGDVRSSPAVGDIDGDSDLEVIVGSNDHKVYAWHHDGMPVVGWPQSTGGVVGSSPAICDIDGDAYPEIIVGSGDGKVYAWYHNGISLGEWPTDYYIGSSPSCGDIDGDGDIEIVVGSYDYKVYAWHHNGEPVAEWPQPTFDRVYSSPALGDIDGDGDIEILVGSGDKKVYAWHHDGSEVEYFPIDVDGGVGASPAIVDIDLDNKTEIVATTENGVIYVWDTGAMYNKTRVLWPMFRHDPMHSASTSPITRITSPRVIERMWAIEDQQFYLNLTEANVFSYGDNITFNSSCMDQIGDIVSYTWASDKDGVIGSSPSLAKNLSRGMHTINLTVLNDRGVSGVARGKVFVCNETMGFSDNTSLFNISSGGVIDFVPTNEDVGVHTINITISDSGGVLGYEVFDLTILNTNDPPSITTKDPPTFVYEDSEWFYDFDAYDEDLIYGDSLRWSVNNTNITINVITGEAKWVPDENWIGNNTINVTVTDNSGASDSFIFNVYVEGITKELSVQASMDKQNYYSNENVTITAYVYDFYGRNASADLVQAEIIKPCGVEYVNLSQVGSNIYKGVFSNTFPAGNYSANVYANKSGYTSGVTNLNFSINLPISWGYYFNVTVNSGGNSRVDAPVEVGINFTEKLQNLGVAGIFDNNSIRIYETDSSGRVIKEVPYLFEKTLGEQTSVNIALNKQAEALRSFSDLGRGPEKAVDGVIATTTFDSTWMAEEPFPIWLKIDLSSVNHFWKIIFYGVKKTWDYTPRDYTIGVSDDNVDWTTVVEVTGNTDRKVTHTFSGVSGKYVNITITKSVTSETYTAITEFEVYLLSDVYNATTNALGNLTWILDNTTPENTTRYYQVRFDILENDAKYPPGYNVSYENLSMTSGLNVTMGSAANNTPPIAIANVSNSTLRNVPLTFNGSASYDPDGDALTYFWDFGDCSGGSGEIVNHTYTALTKNDLGIKNATLTVYDGKGGANVSGVMNINVTNNPPILDINDLNATEDVPFYYDVNASDNDTLTYSDNTSLFDIAPATGEISFTPNNSVANKNYTVNISVTDGLEMDSEVINFEVINVNDAPVLDFIPSQTVIENQTFLLNVSAYASDEDDIRGDVLTFDTNGTNISGFKFNTTTGLANWTPNSTQGGKTYWINFTVYDLENLSDSTVIPLTVVNVNQVPNITLFSPENLTVINETDVLNITINATDPDYGTIPTICLYRNGTELNCTIAEQLNYSWKTGYFDAGTYVFTANVTDGLNTTSQTHEYIVLNVNRPPNVTILSPANNSHFIENDQFSIITSASDPDNESLNYSIKIDGFEISTQANITTLWGYEDAGEHIIDVTVVDPYEASDSEQIIVTVHEPDITLNSSEITFSNTNPTEGETIIITAQIYNIKNATTKPFNVSFYDNGVLIANVSVSLQAYSSTNASVAWLTTYGSHTITVFIDPEQIDPDYEANESNNIASTSIYVRARPTSYVGGGDGPPPVIKEGFQRVESTTRTIVDIILQFRYTSKEFYAVSYELAGVLGALDFIPTTSDLADAIDMIVWKPVQTLDGDPYTITTSQVLAKYPESEKVIIARGDLGVDSLASVAYARALGVPILLVKPGEIPSVTSDALTKLNTTSTIVLGGSVAVSEEVKEKLPRATRIWGKNRHETAVKIAEALMAQQSVDTVVVTDGINPDIMAVMIAMRYGAPIVYTAGDEITPETKGFLEQNKFKRVVIIGTTADINAIIS